MAGRVEPAEQDRRIIESTWALAFRLLRQESDTRLKITVALALFLVLMASASAALSPVLLKLIVDRLNEPGSVDSAYLAAGLLIVVYTASKWLGRSLQELRALATGRADQRLHRRLSLRLFKHLMSLPLRFHLDRKTGALSQTLTNALLGYRILIQHLVASILPIALELGMMSTVLLMLGQPVFLGIIGAALVCYTIAFAVGGARLTNLARAVSAAHIDANALLTDSVLNYETIKSFCAEAHTQQRMENAYAQTEASWARFFSRKALNGMLLGTIFAISLGTSLYVAVSKVQQGRMSLGDFVLVNTYMLQIFRPMETLGIAFRDIAQAMAFIEKMIDLFRQEVETGPYASDSRLPLGPGELSFDRVSFSYSPEWPVLQDISFKVPAGKTVALVGASGSGKSSLVRLLMRFYEPDSGRILIDGMPISRAASTNLRRIIAIVPQDTVLFNDTIAYNIAMGRIDCSEEEIRKAARLADIHNFIISRPDGYDTLVGERGLKLSGGERQRIAIARAAIKKPRIFVFDEATSSLDSKTEQQILNNLARVSRGTTTLVIAHRLSTIVAADEIFVLERGKLVERGTHCDLLGYGGNYASMWGAQQRDPVRPYAIGV